MAKSGKHAGGSLATYTAGFVLSVVLTLIAYSSVTQGVFAGHGLILAVVALAVAQLIVQLVFFLHLGSEKNSRWNGVTLGFAVLVIGIVVIGTLWIMDNLNSQMSTDEMQRYMATHEGI